jgi:hypothetical protein
MKQLINIELVKSAMDEIGFTLSNTEYGTMDSGSAEFTKGAISITIWKDKSIWEFAGTRAELEPLGIWRGYPDTREFIHALRNYAIQKQSAEQGAAQLPSAPQAGHSEGTR